MQDHLEKPETDKLVTDHWTEAARAIGPDRAGGHRARAGRMQVLLKKRIYCIEGIWDWGKREVEPSVEPMLEMLRRQELWEYARRDCATTEEFKYYLNNEWSRCKEGSVLYIASHGSEGSISLSDGHSIGLDTLGDQLEGCCEHCLVHFGGCEVLGGDEQVVNQRISTFLKKTWAMGVSGYRVETAWTGRQQPALGLELLLFGAIGEEVHLENGRYFPALRKIVEKLQERFEDCGFDLYTRTDQRLK